MNVADTVFKEKVLGLALKIAGLELGESLETKERTITPIPDNYDELPVCERAEILSTYLSEHGVRISPPNEAEYQMIAWEKRAERGRWF